MLAPDELRPALHASVRAARRRKALDPDGLPIGVIALDGKDTVVPTCDDFFAQRQTAGDDAPLAGAVRTVTATLVSSSARPVVDVTSIPASTNEMGVFQRALDALMATYGRSDLFRLVTYDAGACSKDNAQAVRQHGLHYAGRPTAPLPGAAVRGSSTGRPLMAALDLLGRRWALRVLWELRAGPLRFRALQSAVGGVSPTVLNQRLSELRDAQLVSSDDAGYVLTDIGRDLYEALAPLNGWAERWSQRTRAKP